MSTTVSLSQAKTHLAKILTDIEELGETITITRSGKPVGVLLSVDDYDGLLETLEILADTDLSDAVEEGLADAEAGRIVSHEKVWGEAGE